MRRKTAVRAGAIALGAMIALAAADADAMVVYAGSDGDLAATVSFDVINGNQLQIVLTNTSTSDAVVQDDILTAVFFDIAGDPVLTPISAVLTTGSIVLYDPDGQPAGGVVGGEWAYRAGLDVNAPASQGISSAGLGTNPDGSNPRFDTDDLFPGANLALPTPPDGVQYGIVGAGDNSSTSPGGTAAQGVIQNSVTFVLSGLGDDFSLDDISNVSFQYNIDLKGPNVTAAVIPVPAALPILGAALAGFGFAGWRTQRKAA